MQRAWKRKPAALGAALLATFGGLWLILKPDPPPPPQSKVTQESAAPAPANVKERRPPRQRERAEFPAPVEQPEAADAPPARSLRGTVIDGALRVDEHGDLILGPEVIAFFDYFLSATGEEPDAVIRARILAAIGERLDGRAAEQATALLDKYLGFREAARTARPDLDQKADPLARLEEIRKLRREHFGDEAATALFGSEEQESAVAAAQSQVMLDRSLSEEEREARLAELDRQLPEEAREARTEARRPLAQQAEEEALREQGATPEELHRHRVATVGPQAAERLSGLDQRRADWKQRVDAFREERSRIPRSTPDPDARRRAEQALLERSFTPQEQLRVRAILSMSGEPLDR